MNLPGGWELILVVVVIMVLFGYKKLPDATRSLGRSMRIFKAETKGLREDGDTTVSTEAAPPASGTVTAQPIAPVVPTPPPAPPAATDAEQVQHRQP